MSITFDMYGLVSLAILFLSGVYRNFLRSFKIAKIGAIASSLSFISCLFLKEYSYQFNLFSICGLDFNLSFEFSKVGLVICSVVSSILCCLHFAGKICRNDESVDIKFGFLNIFAFFMCIAVLSANLFQFYIAIEGMGIISTLLVSFEKDAAMQSSKVFLFNKFASLLFLIAIALIAIEVQSFEFVKIKAMCLTGESSKLFLPAILLLVSVLCKGAQMPFSYWLIDAVKANIFASILIHAGTIVGTGIIFVSKCYFLFDRFKLLQDVMVIVGACTAIWMVYCAIANNNIKKIVACLTASSTGIMFISCGIGMYSLAIFYFICHAFFKSMVFLSFAYLISVASGEQNILKIGRINTFTPKIRVAVWISFLTAVGFPFLPGSFAKVVFMDSVQLSNMPFISMLDLMVNVLAAIVLLRVILLSMYGKTFRATDNSVSYDMKPIYLLFLVAATGAFFVWRLYECGNLHFGTAETICSYNVSRYLVGSIKELTLMEIVISVILIFKRLLRKKFSSKVSRLLISVFRENEIHEFFCRLIKETILFVMHCFYKANLRFSQLIHYQFFKELYLIAGIVSMRHKRLFSSHIAWITTGIIIALIITIVY